VSNSRAHGTDGGVGEVRRCVTGVCDVTARNYDTTEVVGAGGKNLKFKILKKNRSGDVRSEKNRPAV